MMNNSFFKWFEMLFVQCKPISKYTYEKSIISYSLSPINRVFYFILDLMKHTRDGAT